MLSDNQKLPQISRRSDFKLNPKKTEDYVQIPYMLLTK
nr:MAG TPA: hypothetical protein [Caudoviricetes sp.]